MHIHAISTKNKFLVLHLDFIIVLLPAERRKRSVVHCRSGRWRLNRSHNRGRGLCRRCTKSLFWQLFAKEQSEHASLFHIKKTRS